MANSSSLAEFQIPETFALYKEVLNEHFRLIEYRDVLGEAVSRAEKKVSQMSEALPDDFKKLLTSIENRRTSKQAIDDKIKNIQQKFKEYESHLDKLNSDLVNDQKNVEKLSASIEWGKMLILAQLACVNSVAH